MIRRGGEETKRIPWKQIRDSRSAPIHTSFLAGLSRSWLMAVAHSWRANLGLGSPMTGQHRVNVRGLIGLHNLTIPHQGFAFGCDTFCCCVPCVALSAWTDMRNLTSLLGGILETSVLFLCDVVINTVACGHGLHQAGHLPQVKS
jgi:hypothetical protein